MDREDWFKVVAAFMMILGLGLVISLGGAKFIGIPPIVKLEPPPTWRIDMGSHITLIEWDKNNTTAIIYFDNGGNVTLVGDINQIKVYGNGTITPKLGGDS